MFFTLLYIIYELNYYFSVKLRTNEFFRLNERMELSDIEQTEVGLETSADIRLLASIELKIADTKLVGPLRHQGEHSGREHMDA